MTEPARATPGRLPDAWMFAALAGVVYALSIDFMLRGDASMYANYVLIGKFDDLTLHLGYYAFIALLHHSVGALLALPIHELLAWANVALGAASVGVAHCLVRQLTGRRDIAAFASLAFLLSGRVVMNATSSEIYMLQTLLLMLAMLTYVRGTPVRAGLLAGASLLVSPLSAFAFLFFPAWELTAPSGERRWRRLFAAAAAGALVYLPYLVVWHEELFWGRRGLLLVRDAAELQLGATFSRVPFYQAKHYTFLLLLLGAAIVTLRKYRRLVILTLAVGVPHLYIVTKLTAEDNVFLLNTDVFFAALLGAGAAALWARGHRVAATAPYVAHVAVLLAAGVVITGEHHAEYGRELARVAARHVKSGDSMLVLSDWDVRMSSTFFARDSAVSLLEDDPLAHRYYDIGDHPTAKGQPELRGVSSVLLIDPWEAGGLRRLLSSDASIETARRASGVLGKAQRRWQIACQQIDSVPHRVYRCDGPRRGESPPRAE